MSTSVQQLLSSFDTLSDAEKHEAAVELLRRVQKETPGELSEQALVEAADELFRELDSREAANGEDAAR
jgi:hypothetical protein